MEDTACKINPPILPLLKGGLLKPELSDYNPPPLAPPARGGDFYRYFLPLDGGGLGWGCLIINSTSSMIILLRIDQFRLEYRE
jgi:hypothetical protein